MRNHSNIAEMPSRILTRQFDNAGAFGGSTKAVGLTAPTKRIHAMGLAGHNGIVSFILTDGGNQAITLYVWNAAIAALNSGNGWVLNGAAVAEYTKTVDQMAKISFTISEGELFFIKAGTTAVTDCVVSGSQDDQNPNTVLNAASQTH